MFFHVFVCLLIVCDDFILDSATTTGRGHRRNSNVHYNSSLLPTGDKRSTDINEFDRRKARVHLDKSVKQRRKILLKKTAAAAALEDKEEEQEEQEKDEQEKDEQEKDEQEQEQEQEQKERTHKERDDHTNTAHAIYQLLEDHGEAVATLLAGDSFGEGSLISEKPRLATVICREESALMVICKEDYMAIASSGLVFDPAQCIELLGKNAVDRTPVEIERLVKFVRPIPFFSQLDRDVSRKLCACISLLRTKGRSVVVLQGDEVDKHGGCFYIVLRGTVSVHVAENRVHPDATGLRLLMDSRPKDGHIHKEGHNTLKQRAEDAAFEFERKMEDRRMDEHLLLKNQYHYIV